MAVTRYTLNLGQTTVLNIGLSTYNNTALANIESTLPRTACCPYESKRAFKKYVPWHHTAISQ